MSKAQWCEANGIDRRQFYYWQRSLRREAAKKEEAAMIISQPDEVTRREFVDITSLGRQPGETSYSNITTLVPELMIKAGDYQVYVSSAVQEPTLRKVLRVIGNA